MLHSLNFETARQFQHPPKEVYSAILSQKIATGDPNVEGALLSVDKICGTLGEAGHQVAVRYNWGAADLEIIETTLSTSPYRSLCFAQRPERFVTFNSNERRLPATVCMLDDLEGTFQRAFGTTPPVTYIRFDLLPTEQGTDLTVSAELRSEKKLNWFARRRWIKKVPIEVTQILDRVRGALT